MVEITNSTATRWRWRRAAWSCMPPRKSGTLRAALLLSQESCRSRPIAACVWLMSRRRPSRMPACATPVTQRHGRAHTRARRPSMPSKGVMEFLLINHPLDCPICDQGGECQLQDLAVGYGSSASRYERRKAGGVPQKTWARWCRHAGNERAASTARVASASARKSSGVMELGMLNRSEHAEITSFVGRYGRIRTVGQHDRRVPGGRPDISKPVPLQRPDVGAVAPQVGFSPHDSSVGANLIVQVKNDKRSCVSCRFENEDVNECWISRP